MTYLVGIGHKAQQGKTLFAEELHARMPNDSKVYNFSDSIAEFARCLGLMEMEKDPLILVKLGELYRLHDPNFWIKRLQEKIHQDNPIIAIITGVRFPNEFEWIKSEEGWVIEIRRLHTEDGSRFIATDRDPMTYSEIALDGFKFDYVVSAKNGDFEKLKAEAAAMTMLIAGRM